MTTATRLYYIVTQVTQYSQYSCWYNPVRPSQVIQHHRFHLRHVVNGVTGSAAVTSSVTSSICSRDVISCDVIGDVIECSRDVISRDVIDDVIVGVEKCLWQPKIAKTTKTTILGLKFVHSRRCWYLQEA